MENSHQLKRWLRNTVHKQGEVVIGIGVDPQVGMGQRALLVRDAEGNVMWDCVPLLDDALLNLVQALDGLQVIAVSHPHFHTSMVDWAHPFDCVIFIHARNRNWVPRPDRSIQFWEGETKEIGRHMTLIHCGGYFPGSSVLHHDFDGGKLFTGDTFYVNPDLQSITMMYAFPNYIPVSAATVRHVVGAVERFECRRLYGQWWDAVIQEDGRDVIRRSAERYIAAIKGKYDSQLETNPHAASIPSRRGL